MKKRKFFIPLLSVTIFLLLTSNCFAAGPVELNKSGIIPSDSITISLDGRNIYPELIKQDDIIYAKADELLSTFGYRHTYIFETDSIKINETYLPAWRAGYVLEKGNKEIYLPLLETLSLLDIRYTYSDLYGKDVISIRTYEEMQYPYYTGTDNSAVPPECTVDIGENSDNNNININYTQNYPQTVQQSSSGNSNSDYAGYFSPVNSVPALIAKSNFDNQIRGYGIRTRLGFYSVYGVEPQPYGTGFPYALNGNTYNYYQGGYPYTYTSPYYYSTPYYNPCVSPCSTWCAPQPCSTNSIYWGP